jgi:hypothetical protein
VLMILGFGFFGYNHSNRSWTVMKVNRTGR